MLATKSKSMKQPLYGRIGDVSLNERLTLEWFLWHLNCSPNVYHCSPVFYRIVYSLFHRWVTTLKCQFVIDVSRHQLLELVPSLAKCTGSNKRCWKPEKPLENICETVCQYFAHVVCQHLDQQSWSRHPRVPVDHRQLSTPFESVNNKTAKQIKPFRHGRPHTLHAFLSMQISSKKSRGMAEVRRH